MRRGPSLFDQIGRSIYESTVGRIHWRSNMWAVIGTRWDTNRLRHLGEIIRDNHVLVKRRCTNHCPNPPGPDFYSETNKFWSVPATECRKCEFHRKPIRGRRFPCCAYKGEQNPTKAALVTIQKLGDMLQQAEVQALKIIKGE